jgi:hypothetical protein
VADGEIGPRDYLVDPAQFGQDAKAAWREFGEDKRGKVTAAYYQHLLVIKARERLHRAGFHSIAAFADELKLADPQGLAKKFSGSRRAQMDDYLIWAFHLGRAILVTWHRQTDPRSLLFPDHLVERSGARRSPHDSSSG